MTVSSDVPDFATCKNSPFSLLSARSSFRILLEQEHIIGICSSRSPVVCRHPQCANLCGSELCFGLHGFAHKFIYADIARRRAPILANSNEAPLSHATVTYPMSSPAKKIRSNQKYNIAYTFTSGNLQPVRDGTGVTNCGQVALPNCKALAYLTTAGW